MILESGIAFAASLLTATQLVPQTIKVVKTKNHKSISKTTFGMITVSSLLWIVHGINQMDWAIIFANIVTFLCAGTIIYIKFSTKSSKGKR